MIRNDIVHSHIRNMSMAQHIPSSRPAINIEPTIASPSSSPRSSTEVDQRQSKTKLEEGIINNRSPLADLLYLRWLDGLKMKWSLQ
jgi:serine/threonine-protein kinase 24/25/MST4